MVPKLVADLAPEFASHFPSDCALDFEGDSAGGWGAGAGLCAQLARCASARINTRTSTIQAAPLNRKMPSRNSGCVTAKLSGFDEGQGGTRCSQKQSLTTAH